MWSKVEEEIEEFKTEQNNANKKAMQKEFGDILFALVNYARFQGINPAEALEKTNLKFIKRFKYIEKRSAEKGKSISDMDLGEMDGYWEESKKEIC